MRARCFSAAVVLGLASASVLGQTPTYSSYRWNENYAYLQHPTSDPDFFDPIKYIPLGRPDVYLSLGGQIRERYEYFNNYTFGAGAQDEDGYYLTRLLAHADLHMGPNLRFFVEGKSSLEDGRKEGPRSYDADETELQQAFADLTLSFTSSLSTTFRVGRQEMTYGVERLVTVSDWPNARRAFDGLRTTTEYKASNYTNTLDLFLVRPIVTNRERFNEDDDSQAFWGAYDTLALPHLIEKADSKLELYFLGLDQTVSGPPTPRTYDADIYTLGSRFSTKPKPWDFDLETDYQFGTRATQDIQAFSLSTVEGYTFQNTTFTPRLFAGFDYATGDGSRTDATYSTYNQLFPSGHAYFGYIDVVARMNVLSPNTGLELTLLQNKPLAKKLTLKSLYYAFWRANDNDNLYNSSGSTISRSKSSQTFIGQELDLLLTWQINRHTLLYSGYSHFFAGDYISSTSSPSTQKDIDFFYLAAQFTF